MQRTALENSRVFAALVLALLASCTSLTERRYEKSEHWIEMRDGTRLFTAVYVPRDAAPDNAYPILMQRTPYSCRPYGEGSYRTKLGPSKFAMEDGFIFVYQDVRGRWNSEGTYDNMRPHVATKRGPADVDESSDTRDTIDWLLENVDHHNGRVGQWGISYPGFYAAASLADAHPALKAVSPQAPIADFWFDDFHHRGAYTLAYWRILPVFGHQKDGPTTKRWYELPDPGTKDGYRFLLDLGPLSNTDDWYEPDNFFWREIVEHPDYDEFWQARSILPHLSSVTPAVMTVGGLFDAEDLYGPFQIYRTIERENPGAFNVLVMGPWSHGDWSRIRPQKVADVRFGDDVNETYQREVELPFFRHFLKDAPAPDLPEALVFDTGRKEWRRFDAWPPRGTVRVPMHLRGGGRLRVDGPRDGEQPSTSFVSDPADPVPYAPDERFVFTPRRYMAEDQRFAEGRPDVLVFETEPLAEDVTLAGPLDARLFVATTGTDADWVVKLIDAYPEDDESGLGGYRQMVRSEIVRGRYRDSLDEPRPFVPGAVAEVELPLQGVLHTFGAGHRIVVHVQSTWFPLFDRNPQTFVDNVYEADAADFTAQTHTVHHAPGRASRLEIGVLR